jgi:hypothetical protein
MFWVFLFATDAVVTKGYVNRRRSLTFCAAARPDALTGTQGQAAREEQVRLTELHQGDCMARGRLRITGQIRA